MSGNNSISFADLYQALAALPVIDCHTHLDAGHLAARGLHDVLLYHMVISDLYSAGCPDGGRLSPDPDDREITERIERALPFLEKVQNTSCSWMRRMLLADLYDWHEPITPHNWRKLHEIIARRAQDSTWPREIIRRAGVIRLSTEWFLRRDGRADDLLDYALEWAFFARKQWGQNDIPLYELESAWQQDAPSPPLPVTLRNRPAVKRPIRSVADVHAAMEHYCRLIPYGRVVGTAQHISTDIDYRPVSDEEMAVALQRRDRATPPDCDLYASYILEAFLTELEQHGSEIVFQFSLAAEALPFESASRLSQKTIAHVADMIARHPHLRFQCMLASRHGNQSLCTLARELPNFSLAGYWWHSFFPDAIKQAASERLDMLPMNQQIGFFSDAYCVDWVYAKTRMVRTLLAEVFVEKIQRGQYTPEQALAIAAYILKDSAEHLLGMNRPLPKAKRLAPVLKA